MQAVNLLPADARASKKGITSVGGDLPGKKTLQIGGAVAATLALLLAGLYVHERSVLSSKQSTISNDQARLAAVQAQVDAIRTAVNDSRARDAAVESVVSTRMNWDRTMSALARVLPVDVVLNNLQATAPVSAATAAAAAGVSATSSTTTAPPVPASLTITGVAPSHMRVGTVMDRLALLPWLSNVALVSSTRMTDGTTSFSISAGVSEVH
jgi:Tfp pilus assembly protein PilN